MFSYTSQGKVKVMNETQVSHKCVFHFTSEMFTASLTHLRCTIYQPFRTFATCANYTSFWFLTYLQQQMGGFFFVMSEAILNAHFIF